MNSYTVGLISGNPSVMSALAGGLKFYERYRITSLLYDAPVTLPNVDFLIVDLSDDPADNLRLPEPDDRDDIGTGSPRILCIADESDYRRIVRSHPPNIQLSGFLSAVHIERRIGPALDAIEAGLSVYPGGYELVDPEVEIRRFDDEASPSTRLTPREHEVLLAVASGLPSKAIAANLNLSERTVKFHLNALFSKLGVHSRTEAAMEGARRGLIPL